MNIETLLKYHLLLRNYKKIPQSPTEPVIPGVYGIRIDPSTNTLTYTDEAIGFTPASFNNGNFDYGSWGNIFPFNKIKPCILNEGRVRYYLNPDDFTKKLDGSPSYLDSIFEGDVMIEFPRLYWNIYQVNESGKIITYVKIAETAVSADYRPYAHIVRGTVGYEIYVGAYLSSSINSRLYSLSNWDISSNKTINQIRQDIVYNHYNGRYGDGYSAVGLQQLTMFQILYLLLFKNLDSSTVVGNGLTSYNTKTGGLESLGMNAISNGRIKLFGMEDIMGNYPTFIDGVYINNDSKLLSSLDLSNLIDDRNINGNAVLFDEGTIQEIYAGSDLGFLPREVNGNANSGYFDTASASPGSYLKNGGLNGQGIFASSMSLKDTDNSNFASRLLFY